MVGDIGLSMRLPGIEPGPPAWKAGIITTRLQTQANGYYTTRLNHISFAEHLYLIKIIRYQMNSDAGN